MNLKKLGAYLAVYLGLFFLCGCFSKPTMMTMESYDDIQIGTPIAVVVKDNGEPYAVDRKGGSDEYKYVEKVVSGNKLIYQNQFTLFVQDGNVVGKTSVQERVPAFDLIYQEDPNHQQWP